MTKQNTYSQRGVSAEVEPFFRRPPKWHGNLGSSTKQVRSRSICRSECYLHETSEPFMTELRCFAYMSSATTQGPCRARSPLVRASVHTR